MADNSPDTKIFVSRTTRTPAPYRCNLSGNLFGGDVQFAGGAAELADHTNQLLATGRSGWRFQSQDVGVSVRYDGFPPTLHPGGGNHHAFFGVLNGFISNASSVSAGSIPWWYGSVVTGRRFCDPLHRRLSLPSPKARL
mgnify:CR=1 FL=1